MNSNYKITSVVIGLLASTNRQLMIYSTLACALAMVNVGYAQTARPRKVVMQVHQVKAIKECRAQLFGSLGADEIDLGAVVIDPVGGIRSGTLNLGQFGHDGSTKSFSKPFQFIAFKISGKGFPKVRQVLLVLAERDAGGGFSKYLEKLVKEAKAKAAAAPRISTTAPRPGHFSLGFFQAEEVGKEIAKQAAEKLGKALLAIAVDAREDDIFPPTLQSLTVTDENFRFNGKMTSPKRIIRFQKDKCDYSVTYSWRLSP